MYKRSGITRLAYLAQKFRVVAVVGPRQSGKTTLCKATFPDKTYVTLEDVDERVLATNDPRGFLDRFPDGMIIDEAQKVPEIFSYIQGYVDKNNKSGMYILSGSNNFLMQENITQSLAGRVAYLHLLPMSIYELKTNEIPTGDFTQMILKGGYPEPFLREMPPTDWYPNYINTYIERDVRQLKEIKNLQLFSDFIKLLAARIGQLVNFASIGSDIGVDAKTISSWLTILQSSYIIYPLKPFYKNFNKRIVKASKIYFYDTGVACSLLDITNSEAINSHYLKGGLFENLVVLELLKHKFNMGGQDDLFFWRDNTGNEIDLLENVPNQIKAIEIKAGKTIASDFFKNLDRFSKFATEPVSKQLIYNGVQVYTKDDGTVIDNFESWMGKLNTV